MCPKVLIRMNVIWRNYFSRLRIRKVPHRYRSSYHPVAPLGSRILTDPAKVFEHNMWDHMQWSKEEEEAARKKVEENSAVRVLLEEQVKYESEASKYWDTFYKIHKNKFFKDRNWLLREFPEILPVGQKTEEKVKELSWNHVKVHAANCFSRMHCPTMPEEKNHDGESSGSSDGQNKAGSDFSNLDSKVHRKGPLKTELFPGSNATFRILEVGCGAGNSVFPILNTLQNAPEFFLYCCDFASGAVELVKMGSWTSFSSSLCSLPFILTAIGEDSRVGPSQMKKEKGLSPILVHLTCRPLPPAFLRNWLWNCIMTQDGLIKEAAPHLLPSPATQTLKDSWEERICRRRLHFEDARCCKPTVQVTETWGNAVISGLWKIR
ncbi:methyltransferase-like protein 8 isoform X3 [Delphinapterus leucas]|uniref:Methyltransferase-like protein 8 isoform X3 n=1 Tax=Delphinapterus leucas TaxID=9749 RepID=A0A2Y9MV23_DELLE|nr:methyltransferase-like protein 8 isoform X3 [Delphinapterus leucas]